MNKKKNMHNSDKKLNQNMITENINLYNNIKKKYKYGYACFLIESIIKDIYYIFALIILKFYYQLKIEEFSNQGYLLFFFVEALINGGSIYYLILFLIKFYILYSPFNQEWAYIYIWIICCIQLLIFITSVFLFLIKFLFIKLFFVQKFKILFEILCIVIILFNFSSLNELKHDKYSFQIQNFEIKKLSHYKEYFKRHYVNLYLSKDYDVDEYELCFEMRYPKNFSDILKNEPPYSLWEFEKKKDYFIGCRNISFKDNPTIDKTNPLTFFKCDINNKNINVLPNYCISAENRRIKYDLIYELNLFEIFLLFLCYLYSKSINYIFFKYHSHEITREIYNEIAEKNEEEEYEERENDDEREEQEGEDEGEEQEEYEEEEEEEHEEDNVNFRRNKYRKISKKKMKYFKKRQKNRYKKYKNNIQYLNNNKEKQNEEENNDKDIENEKNDSEINENKELNNDNNIKEKKDSNIKENEKGKNEEKTESIVNKESQKEQINENDKEIDDEHNNNKDENNNFNNEEEYYKKNGFIYQFLFGKIINKVKTKFYNILKEIDKDIREDEENY